jgi:hypothetical protein
MTLVSACGKAQLLGGNTTSPSAPALPQIRRFARRLKARLVIDPGHDDAAFRRMLADDFDHAPLLIARQHKILAGKAVDQKPVDARNRCDGNKM